MRERIAALRNVVPFSKLIWQTSPGLTLATLGLRLVRALLPVATLYVGKLIIDKSSLCAGAPGAAEPERLACQRPAEPAARAARARVRSGRAVRRAGPRGRRCSTRCSREQFTNTTSVRLMEHAATLDLEDFEDSELQDKLERARRQTQGRTACSASSSARRRT